MKRTLIFGKKEESLELQKQLEKHSFFNQYEHSFKTIEDLEEFQIKMIDWQPTLVIIISNGARGMEAAYIARKKDLEVPLFWFSDDINFGMKSHRLNCDYFSVKPITEEKLERAFHRCAHLGIRFK